MLMWFSEDFVFDSVEAAVSAFKRGELLVVMDDESRENEGDLLMAAEFATPEKVCTSIHIIHQQQSNHIIGCVHDKTNKWYIVCAHDSSSCQTSRPSSHDHKQH